MDFASINVWTEENGEERRPDHVEDEEELHDPGKWEEALLESLQEVSEHPAGLARHEKTGHVEPFKPDQFLDCQGKRSRVLVQH